MPSATSSERHRGLRTPRTANASAPALVGHRRWTRRTQTLLQDDGGFVLTGRSKVRWQHETSDMRARTKYLSRDTCISIANAFRSLLSSNIFTSHYLLRVPVPPPSPRRPTNDVSMSL